MKIRVFVLLIAGNVAMLKLQNASAAEKARAGKA